MIFRALGYASNAANFEITGIDNGSKCVGKGVYELNVEMRTGGGVPKPMKLSVRIFESSQGSLDPIPAIAPMKLSVRIFESSQGSLDPIPAIALMKLSVRIFEWSHKVLRSNTSHCSRIIL